MANGTSQTLISNTIVNTVGNDITGVAVFDVDADDYIFVVGMRDKCFGPIASTPSATYTVPTP